MTFVSLATAALTAGALAAGPPHATVAGRWTQSSHARELVLVPKVKLEPNSGVSYGANLGGSVGYGSMTRTVVVTEPTPLDVERTMSLSIAPNGGFVWTIVTRHAETPGAKCIKTTRIERRGHTAQAGDRISFVIEGGAESWEKSCGGRGGAPIAASTESYTIVLQGGRMRLADGAADWTFTRG